MIKDYDAIDQEKKIFFKEDTKKFFIIIKIIDRQ